MTTGIKKGLEKIREQCKIFKINDAPPRRFKLTIGTEDLRLNHRVIVDSMFIESRAVIHMIDEATHFSAASFLKNQTAKEIWRTITKLWMPTYMGTPDYLAVDQGSSYISKEMKENLDASGVSLHQAPSKPQDQSNQWNDTMPPSAVHMKKYGAPFRKMKPTIPNA